MSDELDGLATFVAVAEARGFRAAGQRLGITGSAVSQAIRRMEERVGVPLVQRTTRSVRLTQAGERLYEAARPALRDLQSAIAGVSDLGKEPRGTLRIHVAAPAASFLGESLLAGFTGGFPHVQLDLFISDDPIDIVAEGFDAGVRLGEVIDRDMVAIPVSGDLRLIAVGAPSYFRRRGRPKHPRDLVNHDCINWHPTPTSPPYRWEFTEKGRDFAVDVGARILTNDPALNVRLAIEGAGLTMADDERSRSAIGQGQLEAVLETFSAPFPGFYLYFPQRRQAVPALRAFIDYLKESRRAIAVRRKRRNRPL